MRPLNGLPWKSPSLPIIVFPKFAEAGTRLPLTVSVTSVPFTYKCMVLEADRVTARWYQEPAVIEPAGAVCVSYPQQSDQTTRKDPSRNVSILYWEYAVSELKLPITACELLRAFSL